MNLYNEIKKSIMKDDSRYFKLMINSNLSTFTTVADCVESRERIDEIVNVYGEVTHKYAKCPNILYIPLYGDLGETATMYLDINPNKLKPNWLIGVVCVNKKLIYERCNSKNINTRIIEDIKTDINVYLNKINSFINRPKK